MVPAPKHPNCSRRLCMCSYSWAAWYCMMPRQHQAQIAQQADHAYLRDSSSKLLVSVPLLTAAPDSRTSLKALARLVCSCCWGKAASSSRLSGRLLHELRSSSCFWATSLLPAACRPTSASKSCVTSSRRCQPPMSSHPDCAVGRAQPMGICNADGRKQQHRPYCWLKSQRLIQFCAG